MRVAILTVSDRSAEGIYQDESGPLLEAFIEGNFDWQIAEAAVVPDNVDDIRRFLEKWRDDGINLIITTGGTGFSARDVTPEASLLVIERQAPGIAEALRARSMEITDYGMLSRGVAGIARSSLIINLPGNPRAVAENIEVLLPVLPHALKLLAGQDTPHTGE